MKPERPLTHPAYWGAWTSIGLIWLIHWLPLPAQALLGNALGALLALKPGRRRNIVARNLELCFPEVPAATRARWQREVFQYAMRAVIEHGILWWGSEARLRRLIRIENPEAARGDGVRPVIWLAPHFVGLDAAGTRLSMDFAGASMYAQAKDPVSDRYMRLGRTRFIPPRLFAKNAGIKPVLRALKDGLPFYYLPDQDQGARNSIFAPFFGIPAATLDALPRLARLTGAQVVPVTVRMLPWGRGYAIRFHPAWADYPSDDLTADVTRMNAFIESAIRTMPAQYLWLHRRFKTRPPGEPSLYA